MALLITIAIRILETIFAVGAIGSVLVLVLTMIEDFQELFGKEKTIQEPVGDYLPVGSKR
jgi:hypothetical protein